MSGIKDIWARFSLRKSLGLHVGDREVTLSRTAQTAFGPVELWSRSETFEGGDGLALAVETLLKPLLDRKGMLRTPLAVGLPSMRVFFSSRPIQGTEKEASPTILLHEVLRSSSVNVDEMAIDLVRSQPGKRPLASLVSCRRKYLSAILAALEQFGIRPFRAEPAPFALLRLARLLHRSPRKAKVVIRVFLGATSAVALFVSGDQPLSWRTFELPPGEEGLAVRSAVTALEIMGKFSGEEAVPDLIFIHGRPDLTEALGGETFAETVRPRVRHVPDPAFDDASVAHGLAIGCAQEGGQSFDLARVLKRKASFWELIPWGELAIQAALLICLSLFLNDRAKSASRTFKVVRVEAAKHPWLEKVDDGKLEKEKKELEERIETVRKYLETRILWTSYLRDAATGLPDSIMLKSLSAVNDTDTGGKKGAKPKKSLVLKLSAPIPMGTSMPREIDDYINKLRADPRLRKDFPVIDLADLRWAPSAYSKGESIAEFTVNCTPKVDKAAAKPAAKKAEEKK